MHAKDNASDSLLSSGKTVFCEALPVMMRMLNIFLYRNIERNFVMPEINGHCESL